jgi:hypothetical protein
MMKRATRDKTLFLAGEQYRLGSMLSNTGTGTSRGMSMGLDGEGQLQVKSRAAPRGTDCPQVTSMGLND